jgi:dipeptidyl aminopeptidase/acylaminoacyl peptidase
MRVSVLVVLLTVGLGLGSARADPPPLEAYAQAPSIERAALSPSGRRLAVVVRDSAGGNVYVTEIGGPQLMAAPIGDATVGKLEWAGEDIVLVDVADPNGKQPIYGYPAVGYAIDLAAKKATRTGGLPSDIRRVSGDSHDPGSHWYGYRAGYLTDASAAWGLFKRDLETGAHARLPIAVSPSGVSAAEWSVDEAGTPNARLDYYESTGRWTVRALQLKRTVASGGGSLDCVCLWGLGSGRTSDTVLLRTRGDDGYITLFEAPLAGDGSAHPLTQGREVTNVWRDPDTGRATGYTWSDDREHYVFFDPSVQERADAALADVRRARVSLISASRDFSRFIAYSDGVDDSGTYWVVDIQTGDAVAIGSAYPGVPPAATGAESIFQYKAADGLPLAAVLTLPPTPNSKGLPLLVLINGPPEERVGPSFHWIAQAFASRGYAVLEPNFRGTSGYGKAFRDAGFGELGRKMQTDLSDGVDALAAAGVVDPKRVCIMGAGYGGYAATAGVTVQHGRYRCAVAYQGLLDLKDFLGRLRNSDERFMAIYWEGLLGGPKADAGLGALSPTSRASDANAPILLIDTKQEDFLVTEAPAMVKALRAAGKTVETASIGSYDYASHSAATRAALLNAAVAFVEKYNPSDGP